MAASSTSSTGTTSWPKWQIALVFGAPVAIGLGVWYYRSNRSRSGRGRRKSVNGTTDKRGNLSQGSSLDGGDSIDLNSQGNASEVVLTPLEKAQNAKNKGNKYFKAGRYSDAIKCYNDAILECPKENMQDLATFYQNRAAAHEQLKNYEAVREDCTKALALNPKYTKALHRRAKACEYIKDLQQSLEDVTAVCILEGFQNQSSLLMADRVLKDYGRQHAREAMAKRVPVMPSKHFIKTYFSSFSEDVVTKGLDDDLEGDSTNPSGFVRARQAFHEGHYDDIIGSCTEELDEGGKDGKYYYDALLLRATFYLLMGDHGRALADLTEVAQEDLANVKLRVNALIKRASLHVQLEEPEKSLDDFKIAADLDPDNSDVYHHRGQVELLMDKMSEAIADFDRAVSLNSNFPIAYVQKCYTDYRHALAMRNMDAMKRVMEKFEEAVTKFPTCSECHTLFAQVLSDQEEYDNADKYFQKASVVDPENATIYVHRGLLQLQWKADVAKASELINKAIEMDDKCEFGYETLGTIEVQRGNLTKAIELFDKAIPLAKTEVEMTHLFSLRDAAIAQKTVAEKMGIAIPSMGSL